MATTSDETVTELLHGFPRDRTSLLPALHAVQHRLGHLPESALAEVSRQLRVPASEVWSVASGYPEFRLAPRGRHHVRVCTGVSCWLTGGDQVLAAIARRQAETRGERDPDRSVTIEETDCFFACAVGPVMEVDGACRGRMTEADVARLDQWLAASAASSALQVDGHPASAVAPLEAPASASGPGGLEALVERARPRRTARPTLRLVVHAGSCARAVGADLLLERLRTAVEARRLDARVVDGACTGMCYAAPSVGVERPDWPRFIVERVAPDRVDALLDCLADHRELDADGWGGVCWSERPWRGLVPAGDHPFWHSQERVLLARAGLVDPNDLDDALEHGGYRALDLALARPAEDVIAAVERAGLQGRGGAFFPTATKWAACRKATGQPKYVVVNGEEGEPGIFKDRHLMEGDPHQLLEGALLAAYAAGASRVIVYVHGEADLAASRLDRAIRDARAAGIIGPRVLGRDFACEVELRRGAGGFVLGEETALLESIEGRRAQPRTRPPFPVEAGLWGRPTVINNVETLSAIPHIVARGGAWFAALGTAAAPGTKVFGLSGPLARPGVVEVRNGVSLRTLLEEIGGGLTGGRAFRGAVVGGPSGSIVPAALFGAPMEPRGAVSPGTGGIAAVPADASVVDIVKRLLAFNARESCGKCTPCREGTPRLLAMIDELDAGSGGGLERARPLAEAIQLASLCGLGQAAPVALLRALEMFPDQFRAAR